MASARRPHPVPRRPAAPASAGRLLAVLAVQVSVGRLLAVLAVQVSVGRLSAVLAVQVSVGRALVVLAVQGLVGRALAVRGSVGRVLALVGRVPVSPVMPGRRTGTVAVGLRGREGEPGVLFRRRVVSVAQAPRGR
ncbi:hypothetical protein [Actinoplanes sp. NPDC048796]|uniref:hypothetical protein n=1 Tax=Actinoplanes sp. NPDC048796 TaxID=3155640 RepID=UPI0033FB6705